MEKKQEYHVTVCVDGEVSCLEMVRRKISVENIISIFTIVVSVIALFIVTNTVVTDKAQNMLDKAEANFSKGNYEKAYQQFSATVLYDNPYALAYLGYMQTNGLGCSIDIAAGTNSYKHAMTYPVGRRICIKNYAYNVINYSGCYYEISDAIIQLYENGDAGATTVLVCSLFSRSTEEVYIPNELCQPEVPLADYLQNNEGDRIHAIAELLATCVAISTDDEMGYDFLSEPKAYHHYDDKLMETYLQCVNHELCIQCPLSKWTLIEFERVGSSIQPVYGLFHREIIYSDYIEQQIPFQE